MKALLALVIVLAATWPVSGQSLLRQPPSLAPVVSPGVAPPAPAAQAPVSTVPTGGGGGGGGPRQPSAPAAGGGAGSSATPAASAIQGYSLFAVVPPQPRQYAKHDQVEIIINETSIQKYEQSLDTEKKPELTAKVSGFPSIRNLLEAQVKPGDSTLIDASVSADKKFEGDGTYERKDRFTTRIAATVLEVKPNGVLVLEARKSVLSNGENAIVVVAGMCRPEDITTSNTVQSTQLADLVIKVENEGDVNDASKKGWLTQFFDAVFGF